MSKLRLGFHYHIPAQWRDGQIYLPGYFGRFIDSLAENCAEIICFFHEPAKGQNDLLDYPLTASNVRLVSLGQHTSVPTRMVKAPKILTPIKEFIKELDVFLIRGPSPLLPFVAHYAHPLPMALLLVGDYEAGINDLPQPWWRKEAIRLWVKWNKYAQNRVVRKSITFVNSRQLYKELLSFAPNLYEIRTTTLNPDDFCERIDTCFNLPVRLLYTGRLSVSKGLPDIVEAMALLVNRGENIILDLVGWPEKREETIVSDLQSLAKNRGIPGRIFYHGYKAVGPDLFSFYRQADIFVIASRSSFEGFPRSIWEAMAQSLPVVATRVGSIPDFIEGTAMLVSPSKPEEIAKAVFALMNDPNLRQKIIRNGIQLARENTLEKQSKILIEKITSWLEERACQKFY